MCVLERACWCRSRVLLCQSGVCALELAYWCCCRVLLSECAGAAAGCRCFRGCCCCVRLGAGLLVPLKGAVAGCGCRVILSKGCYRVLLSECGVGYEAWVLVWLRDVYGSVDIGPGWRLCLCRSKKKHALGCHQTKSFAIWGLCWRNFINPSFLNFLNSQCFFGVKQQGCPASPTETLLRMVLR